MFKRSILFLILIIPAMCYAGDDSYRQEIRERIAPVGQVHLEEVKTEVKVEKPKEVSPGEQVFNSYCTACHSMGVAGAPKRGNASDWKERRKKGVDQLVQVALKGIAPAMPPKGTCAECTEAQIKAAILYMLPK